MPLSVWNRAILAVVLGSSIISPASSQDAVPTDGGRASIDGLRAKGVDARRAAANQVRLSGRDEQRQALPTLIDLLMSEKDGQVRLAVLDAVTSLGPEAESAIPALVHTLRTNYGGLGQEESHQDYRSSLALASIGKPAVESLRGLLKEKKESVRAEVAMGLGRIGPDAGPAVPDLIPLLRDGSARIRREASRSLGLIGPPAIEALVAASADGNLVVRSGAIEALGISSSPDDRARLAIEGATHDAAPEVRSAAVRSLAGLKLPDEALRPILLENLRHDDERVRLAVVNLLIERPTLLLRMIPECESLLTDGREGVARHAAFLLGKTGRDAVPRLLAALRREGSRVDSIAGALAQIGRPAVGMIEQAVADPDPRVRRGAALALGQIRPLPSGAAGKLTAGLTDPDPEVRMAFLTAIGNLGPRASESVPAVRVLLRDGSPELRSRAIEVLLQSAPRDGQMLNDLSTLLDDPDRRVQRRAIDSLRALGPPGRKALPVVIDRLGSDDPEVRFAAAQFVEGHGSAAAEAIPLLSKLLGDPMPKIRMLAATTLGRFGKASQPSFPSLAALVGDTDVGVREAATSALGSLDLDAETVRPALARALRDEKAEVRRAATRAIPRLGPQGVVLVPDIIAMAARKENLRSVDRLLRPFEKGGPDVRSLPELVKLLEHEQAAVRVLAIKFLGLAGRHAKEALPALERIRDDPSEEVRQQAKVACEQIQKDAESGRPQGGASD